MGLTFPPQEEFIRACHGGGAGALPIWRHAQAERGYGFPGFKTLLLRPIRDESLHHFVAAGGKPAIIHARRVCATRNCPVAVSWGSEEPL